MGRVIECCAPVVMSDVDRIHELVELANRNKIPTRRVIEASGEVIVDLEYAWGLDNAFNMVTKHLPVGMAETALDRYRSLGWLTPVTPGALGSPRRPEKTSKPLRWDEDPAG